MPATVPAGVPATPGRVPATVPAGVPATVPAGVPATVRRGARDRLRRGPRDRLRRSARDRLRRLAPQAEQVPERGVTHPDLALAQFAGQERHGDRHLLGCRVPEQPGDEIDFRSAPGNPGDLRGHQRDLVQEHGDIVLRATVKHRRRGL